MLSLSAMGMFKMQSIDFGKYYLSTDSGPELIAFARKQPEHSESMTERGLIALIYDNFYARMSIDSWNNVIERFEKSLELKAGNE